VFLGFAAMLLQTVAVHAHSHAGVALPGSSVSADGPDAVSTDPGGSAGQQAPAGPHPLQDDPANCPICKQSHGGGQFFAPTAALFALPAFINVSLAVFDLRGPTPRTASYSRQTRAPPTA
jgi:hypothetical protein